MPTVTTPTDRLKRILSEGARFTATCPQQTSIDVTPDIMALLGGVQTDLKPLGEARNLLKARDLGRDLATRVHFP